MNLNDFQREVDRAYKSLVFHRKVDVVLRVITFGLCTNRACLQRCKEDYREAKSKYDRYASLIVESQVAETIQIQGVRISKHTFSDLQVVGGQDYGIHWDALRQTILSRDNYECQQSDGLCYGPLQIHHIIPLSKGGSNDPSNLITLCLYHHTLKHEHMRRN